MELFLCTMTKELSRAYYRDFVQDPSLFADPSRFRPYIYSAAAADAHWERQNALGRVHLAVMLGAEPIGDVVLKNRNAERRSCEFGICMKNDSVQKAGFRMTHRDEMFCYYRCDKASWTPPEIEE